MRTRLLATVALLSLSTAAFAADLPSRRAPAPYVVVPVFTWTGFYVGGNVGGGVGDFRTTNFANTAAGAAALATGARPTTFNNSTTGFTGGGQIGYNYQIGQFVIGVEADASYTDFSQTRTVGIAGATDSIRDDLKYLGTVRGRVGYAFDRIMVYGTGGFAYGDVYTRETFGTGPGALAFTSGSRSDMRTGYAYGGGIEYAIPTGSFFSFLNFFNTSAVTIKAEYLHYDLGRQTYGLNTVAGVNNYTARTRTDGDIGRIGVNYKF